MSKFRCKYCGNQMSEYDFKNNNGLCLICLEIKDWKNIIKNFKKYKG